MTRPNNASDVPFEVAPDKVVVLHTRVVTETGGGPEKTILMSAPFLAQSEYALAAAYMHAPNDEGFDVIRRRARAWNSPLIGVPDKGAKDLRVLWQMLRLCRKYKVKVWHAHDYKSNLFGLLLRPFHRMQLVTTVHGWVVHTEKTPLYYKIDKWCLPHYQHVICVSDDLYREVSELGVPQDRLTYLPNAIDESDFCRKSLPADAPMRMDRGVPASRILAGAVGRLMPEKSFDQLIRAAAQLLNEGVDLEVWIAGEGSARQSLQALIHELQLGERVKLIGFCDDTKAFYESLDMFVLASQREGLPNVILEAAAMNVPIVSTRVAGVPKMLTDGESGILCDIGDLNGLTSAIRRLARDDQKRASLASSARKLIEKQYSFRKRMERICGIYDRMLGKPV
ncbi:glycosyl transferase family 1 [Rhodopirellula sp. SM50]|nr:glycosyltransferase [Rhodopirellula sp. SM50]PAY20627.1 glycosyl transferase family 1 [Rhodopirellula sp. SM50]